LKKIHIRKELKERRFYSLRSGRVLQLGGYGIELLIIGIKTICIVNKKKDHYYKG